MANPNPKTADDIAGRIDDLKAKLAARTRGGKPLPNYGENVAAIQKEIARLERRRDA